MVAELVAVDLDGSVEDLTDAEQPQLRRVAGHGRTLFIPSS
jgi:hypothetical protein